MAQSKPDTAAVTDMMNQVQNLMTANPMMAPQITNILQVQQRFLNEAQEYSKHWFTRRQEALETAMKTADGSSNSGANEPTSAMTALADWQKRSMTRMTEDFQEWVDMCSRCIGPVTTGDAKTKK